MNALEHLENRIESIKEKIKNLKLDINKYNEILITPDSQYYRDRNNEINKLNIEMKENSKIIELNGKEIKILKNLKEKEKCRYEFRITFYPQNECFKIIETIDNKINILKNEIDELELKNKNILTNISNSLNTYLSVKEYIKILEDNSIYNQNLLNEALRIKLVESMISEYIKYAEDNSLDYDPLDSDLLIITCNKHRNDYLLSNKLIPTEEFHIFEAKLKKDIHLNEHIKKNNNSESEDSEDENQWYTEIKSNSSESFCECEEREWFNIEKIKCKGFNAKIGKGKCSCVDINYISNTTESLPDITKIFEYTTGDHDFSNPDKFNIYSEQPVGYLYCNIRMNRHIKFLERNRTERNQKWSYSLLDNNFIKL